MSRIKRYEFSTVGFDADLQLVGSDALRGDGWTGLPIPAARPLTASGRYTFLVSLAQFAQGEHATLVGMRQLVEIGTYLTTGEGESQAAFPLKRLIETPTWRFVDGNVMWSVRRILPATYGGLNSATTDGLAWRMSNGIAQLYESMPTGAPILPPFNGTFPGEAFEPNLVQFYDLRYPWINDSAAKILRVPIVGPCSIALFASVMQTDPKTRLVLPGTPGDFSTQMGITVEDAFVGNNPFSDGVNTGVNYTRIAGSLIFDMVQPPKTVPEWQGCRPVHLVKEAPGDRTH